MRPYVFVLCPTAYTNISKFILCPVASPRGVQLYLQPDGGWVTSFAENWCFLRGYEYWTWSVYKPAWATSSARPLPLHPQVRMAGDATAYVNLSHLTTNSISHQCTFSLCWLLMYLQTAQWSRCFWVIQLNIQVFNLRRQQTWEAVLSLGTTHRIDK